MENEIVWYCSYCGHKNKTNDETNLKCFYCNFVEDLETAFTK